MNTAIDNYSYNMYGNVISFFAIEENISVDAPKQIIALNKDKV